MPAIAVSAENSPDGFANAASFTVDLVNKLAAERDAGAPLLPDGEGLSVNVPGSPELQGVAVTTITQESSAAFPISLMDDGTYGSTFIPNTTSSGSPTAEGAQFILDRITVSAIDGNWGATEPDRADLEQRIGALLDAPTPQTTPLDILLVNDDGYDAPGIQTARDKLLDAGYNVTVVAPATGQSGVGSALTLGPITVTRYDQGFQVGATPATTVATGLDALLTGEDTPI